MAGRNPTRECGRCGAAFVADHGPQLYCSPECFKAQRSEKQNACSRARKARLRATRPPKQQRLSLAPKANPIRACGKCGADFTSGKGAGYRFCSARCRKAHASGKDLTRACVHCGTTFEPGRAASKYCSTSCAGEFKLARDRRRERDPSVVLAYRIANAEKIKEHNRAKSKLRDPAVRRTWRENEARKKGKSYQPFDAEWQAKREAAETERAARAQAAAITAVAKEVAKAYASHIMAGVKYQRRCSTASKWGGHRPNSAIGWRHRYRTDEIFRQVYLQHLKASKLRRKGAMTPGVTSNESVALYAEFDHCPYCECALNRLNKTLDHMTPLSLGGLHAAGNLIVCCSECNTRKRAKPFMRWAMSLRPDLGAAAIREFNRKRLTLPNMSEAA